MSQLATELSGLVEDELRAFNVERLYATDKSSTALSIVEAARQLPMMSERRVVVVLRAEKLLKPKRKGKAGDVPEPDEGPTPDVDALEDYVKRPEPQTTLVLVASDIDRTRRLSKALLKQATIVECWGLKQSKDAKVNLWQVAKQAEQLVRQAVTNAGQQIDLAAARLVAERAGADISRLRGDVDRLLLNAAGKPRITVADAREVVSSETAQDDWAVTTAIQRGDTAEALRQLGLSQVYAPGLPQPLRPGRRRRPGGCTRSTTAATRAGAACPAPDDTARRLHQRAGRRAGRHRPGHAAPASPGPATTAAIPTRRAATPANTFNATQPAVAGARRPTRSSATTAPRRRATAR